MRKKTTINVGNRFLTPEGIGRNALTTIDCLSELIANCFDWNINKIDNSLSVDISISVGKDQIIICDNGAGMNIDELDVAINLSEAEDSQRAKLNSESRKGMYGMGLKIAVLTLGWQFKIETRSFNEEGKQHNFFFDANQLRDKKSDYLENGLFLETKIDSTSFYSNYQHGTKITITDLVKREQPSIIAIKDELEERFQADIANLSALDKINFTVTDTDLQKTYKLEPLDINSKFYSPYLKTDFEKINEWNKKEKYIYQGTDEKPFQLRGYFQLLKNRSVKDQHYGIHLFYHGQLIERYHKGSLFKGIDGRWMERFYGELHLDGCNPDPSKKSFLEDDTFTEVRNLISEDLQTYRTLGVTTKKATSIIEKAITQRRPTLYETTDTINNNQKSQSENKADKSATPKENSSISLAKNQIYLRTINLKIEIKCENINKLPSNNNVNWEYIYVNSTQDKDLKLLNVYINANCIFYSELKKMWNNPVQHNLLLAFYKKVAISECLNSILINEHNLNADKARQLTDSIIYPWVTKQEL